MVIIDTSVWIDFLRRPGVDISDIMRWLIQSRRAALVGPVVAEILQGTRPDQEARLRRLLRAVAYLDVPRVAWIRAGEIARDLRSAGLITPLTDLAIAAAAMEGGHEVFTRDKHFERIPGLRLFDPNGAAGG